MINNLFLDRDGIINEIIYRDSKVESPRSLAEFKIRTDFVKFYNSIVNNDLKLFVISNQPDISRRKMDIQELELMTADLRKKFNFKEISYCMHDDGDNCSCRKPKPGMIQSILLKYNLDKEESLLIGDSIKDINAGKNAGIKTVLLLTDYNKDKQIEADYHINNLHEILTLMRKL